MKSEEATQQETSWPPFPVSSANTCHLASVDPRPCPKAQRHGHFPQGKSVELGEEMGGFLFKGARTFLAWLESYLGYL